MLSPSKLFFGVWPPVFKNAEHKVFNNLLYFIILICFKILINDFLVALNGPPWFSPDIKHSLRVQGLFKKHILLAWTVENSVFWRCYLAVRRWYSL